MDKEQLLDLLDDPDVIDKIKGIIGSAKPTQSFGKSNITPVQTRVIASLCNWWNKQSKTKIVPSKLSFFEKTNIILIVKKHGQDTVKTVLKKAIDSPLNVEGEFMSRFLGSLVWCTKDVNFMKIQDGKYDERFEFGEKKEYQNDDTDEDDLNNLMI